VVKDGPQLSAGLPDDTCPLIGRTAESQPNMLSYALSCDSRYRIMTY